MGLGFVYLHKFKSNKGHTNENVEGKKGPKGLIHYFYLNEQYSQCRRYMQIMKNGLKGYKTLKSGDGRIFTFGRKPSLEHLLTKSQEQHLAGLACGYTGCECVCVCERL